MSRGKFLGMGVAAAATFGTAGVVAADEPQTCAVRPSYCGTFHTSPPPAPTWIMPASILQIFWGEVFPRMVAQAWQFGCPVPFPPGDVTPSLNGYLVGFRNLLFGTASPSPGQVAAFNATRFGRRFEEVRRYLATSAGMLMPIRYHGPGGFDFILSDYGLDLFSPRPPENSDDLLRYFEYREPGRPTIGLPSYLVASHAFDVQSPTGPSQIWTDSSGLSAPISASGCALEGLPCLDDTQLPFPESLEGLLILEEVLRMLGWRGDPDTPAYVRRQFRPFSPVRSFTIQGFYSAASKVRCWQLEGSVYRGILEQLPRVVATVWREQGSVCATGSYAARFNDPEKMRTIFEERLESTLPGYDEMIFEVGARPGQSNLVDIEISNQGLRFPFASPQPDLTGMLASITAGEAGNPVFTDTKRPDGDE